MAKQDAKANYSLDQSATHLLHRAHQAAVTLSAGALAMKGLTIRQFAVLAALHTQDGQNQSSLVTATGIDRSTLADMVSRMEKGGLIRRTPSTEDARAKAVSLAPAGEIAFQEALPQVQQADALLLNGLRSTRRDSLISALAILAGAGEPEPEKAAKKPKKAPKKDKKKKKKKKKPA